MKRLIDVSEEKGFTLIELMAMLVIIGVMASVAVKKYSNISTSAELRAIEVGISELNSRETLTWANLIINQGRYPGDEAIWAMMIASTYTDIGSSYQWTSGPDKDNGGHLSFGSQTVSLIREASTLQVAARWRPSET
ncbi:MAG: prepilin-type N-terminal cleavage/methylation domain-containing protein [Desulfobacterales bacterium]|jgi:prepilin-type N-terminal cleavage/methylation domain-containing protein